MGASSDCNGQVQLRIKWLVNRYFDANYQVHLCISIILTYYRLRNRKGCETIDVVPLNEAKSRCPEIVIEYLSGQISWVKESEEKK